MSDYKRMKAFDKMTKELKGYVGVGAFESAALVHSANDAAMVKFENRDGSRALAKDTSPSDRWLTEGLRQYAEWGLGKNYVWVVWDDDHTISMKDDRNRKLYWYERSGTKWLCWTGEKEKDNQAILTFELE
ncbi:MAG TPA: hypothetical protein VJY34_11135 [Roseiarcus sp.]|nr:hypothetical protein [Roseiarcus sp.]